MPDHAQGQSSSQGAPPQAQPAPPAPGRSSLVAHAEAGPEAQAAGQTPGAPAASENDPAVKPPRYAALHDAIVQLLWRSRDTYFKNQLAQNLPFWRMVDAVTSPDLQTLVQIHRGATAAGFWSAIQKLDDREGIYTYGSSWGIHFISDGSVGALVTNGAWGKDFPQVAVQRSHGEHGPEYTWYRQNSGAGNPGLHMGLGGKNINVHWDPTNPMERVATGLEMTPFGPVYIPPGTAIYSPSGVVAHLGDIWGDGHVQSTATPQPFLSITLIEHTRRVGGEMANAEQAVAQVRDPARRDTACARVLAALPAIQALEPRSRTLAQQDTAANRGAVDALAADFQSARAALFGALTNLFAYLQDDVRAPSHLRKYHQLAEWDEMKNMIWGAHAMFQRLQKSRQEPEAEVEPARPPGGRAPLW